MEYSCYTGVLSGHIAALTSDSGLLLHMEYHGQYVGHVCELCKNGSTDRDAVANSSGPKEPFIRLGKVWTNLFAAERGDKLVMRPFVKILWPLVIIIITIMMAITIVIINTINVKITLNAAGALYKSWHVCTEMN